jgi:hypothetical protein
VWPWDQQQVDGIILQEWCGQPTRRYFAGIAHRQVKRQRPFRQAILRRVHSRKDPHSGGVDSHTQRRVVSKESSGLLKKMVIFSRILRGANSIARFVCNSDKLHQRLEQIAIFRYGPKLSIE